MAKDPDFNHFDPILMLVSTTSTNPHAHSNMDYVRLGFGKLAKCPICHKWKDARLMGRVSRTFCCLHHEGVTMKESKTN